VTYKNFNQLQILVTGGTGSFGKEFVKNILNMAPGIKRLVVFSRDELKQYEMEKLYSTSDFPGLRYFIGDIRDLSRLNRAMQNIDIVIHAAALKQVPAAEYNPFEFIKTNILGAQNVIEASIDNEVKKVIALSTDKAAAPINLYGATKLCSDKLFIAANNIKGSNQIKFAVVRYGNVMFSRGSVIPFFMEKRKTGKLPITSEKMTRFNISLKEGVDMVRWAIDKAKGGEIFVPKIPSYRITDIAKAIDPDCKLEIIGVRPGEKIHEEMITHSDSLNTIDIGKYYAILPAGVSDEDKLNYSRHHKGKIIEKTFSYTSDNNPNFLTVNDLKKLISKQ
jgi:UDP-N-acetylglucosamine 4,6-dehydratase/5-epimerase